MTNYEQVKVLTVEQMAQFLLNDACHECAYFNHAENDCKKPKGTVCRDGIREWLNSEYKPKGGTNAML